MNRSKMLSAAMVLTLGSLLAFGRIAEAKDIECSVNLVQADKSSSWGFGGESKLGTVKLVKQPNSNYSGNLVTAFTKSPYKVSLQIQVGDASLANTWSSITAVLYKVVAGKNKIQGSVMIPNTYYSAGVIAPQEVWMGNSETLDKVANEPGVLDKLDLSGLASKFADGDVLGAMLACTPN